jgi:hypothetical protein
VHQNNAPCLEIVYRNLHNPVNVIKESKPDPAAVLKDAWERMCNIVC